MLLMVVNALVLGIGLVAAVDLRRLQTPQGTALRWVQAAVFGDCDDFLRFSVADGDLPDTRSPVELCQDLRVSTEKARTEAFQIGLHVRAVEVREGDATAKLAITRDGDPTDVTVHLVRRQGEWLVQRDSATCSSVGCG